MQREVRELVPQHRAWIAGVRAGAASLHHDAMLVRHRDCRAPVGSAGAGPLAEASRVGRDRDQRARMRARKSGEAVVARGLLEERAREGQVRRVGDDGETAAIEALRLIRLRARAWRGEEQQRCESSER